MWRFSRRGDLIVQPRGPSAGNMLEPRTLYRRRSGNVKKNHDVFTKTRFIAFHTQTHRHTTARSGRPGRRDTEATAARSRVGEQAKAVAPMPEQTRVVAEQEGAEQLAEAHCR